MRNKQEIITDKESVFVSTMKNYSYIIDEKCTGEKTPDLVRRIIPILICWAKKKETDHTYGDLNKMLGYKDGRFTQIGHPLGCIENVFIQLEEETGEYIPTLNALVNNVTTGLPSEGFSYVHPKYDEMDSDEKRIVVDNENNNALNYDRWDWVLASLGLKPSISKEDELKIRSGASFGGESPEHKRLKEYIASHPKSIDIMSREKGVTEHILLSGDKLDVYFPKANVVVEVKPKSAPDADILRGLFQCVKYKSILDAEASVKGEIPDSEVVLVIGGTLSESNRIVQECLNIEVIENFDCCARMTASSTKEL